MATIIDSVPLSVSTRRRPSLWRTIRDARGYMLFFSLHVTGLLSSTLLISWGLIVLFFLAIGGFSVDGAMHHLANLADRYVQADAGRVTGFKVALGIVQITLVSAVLFMRRHLLIPADRKVSEPQA